MPSRGEGFGIAYIEAMRRGLPVVASTHDAGREINLDQQTGFNVSLDQPGELASRLTTLLREPELIRRFGSAAHARWRNEFRYSAFSRRFRPLLEGFMRP
jgi:phosphatidylinositol alpha-1,6-mannosyltransferase